MRIPKVLIFILLGLPALLLTGPSGRAASRSQHHMSTPALREAGKTGIEVCKPAQSALSQDLEKPVVTHRTPALRVLQVFRDPSNCQWDSPAAIRLTAAGFRSRQQVQASAYQERAFVYYGLLIFPHHDFW